MRASLQPTSSEPSRTPTGWLVRAADATQQSVRLPAVYRDPPDTTETDARGHTRRRRQAPRDGHDGHRAPPFTNLGSLPKPRAQVRFLPGALSENTVTTPFVACLRLGRR
jgi:hypothetical protein